MEPLARVKHLELRSVVPDELPISYGDERRLMQVLLNLIGNAIKFTDKGYVEITASAADGLLTINLSDSGIGITEEDQEQIFGAFQQGSNRGVLEQGGTGLGLAISKSIVEMHGGSIAVHSKVGFGSTFIINLPLEPASASREVA
jgi:signal transduction histidine kinase